MRSRANQRGRIRTTPAAWLEMERQTWWKATAPRPRIWPRLTKRGPMGSWTRGSAQLSRAFQNQIGVTESLKSTDPCETACRQASDEQPPLVGSTLRQNMNTCPNYRTPPSGPECLSDTSTSSPLKIYIYQTNNFPSLNQTTVRRSLNLRSMW